MTPGSTEARSQQVKGLVHEVLADADTRASLLENGLDAGHNGKRFFLASSDGGFLMEISGQIQVRYVYNNRSRNGGGEVDDENEGGFEVRRAKLKFAGHIASPRLFYKLKLSVSRSDNEVEAQTIVIGYKLTDELKIWGGEFKAAFLREESTSSSRQLAAERSVINEIFTVGYVQGVGIKWKGGDVFKVRGSATPMTGPDRAKPIRCLSMVS